MSFDIKADHNIFLINQGIINRNHDIVKTFYFS